MIRLLIDSEAAARTRHAAQQQLVEADLLAHKAGSLSTKEAAAVRSTTEKSPAEKEEVDQAVRTRLDGMGFKVGWALSERSVLRCSLFPAPTDSLPRSQARERSTSVPLYARPRLCHCSSQRIATRAHP